jgi:hypothetical protein
MYPVHYLLSSDELLCLRELLGTLQTLCWDKQCVRGVLQADIISHLIDYVQVQKENKNSIFVFLITTLGD